MRLRFSVVVGLTAVWLLLWGSIDPITIVGGLLVSVIIIAVFPFPPAMWEGVLRPLPFVILIVRFLYDLTVASFQLAWIAVRPKPVPRSAVIGIDLHSRSELLLSLTAELVCLVPGTLLVDLDGRQGRIWLHVLDGTQDLDQVRQGVLAQERRVIAALGSRKERDAYCRKEAV